MGDDDPYLSSRQAAELLGCSVKTLHRWTDDFGIPCACSPGRRRSYRLSDVLDLVQRIERGDFLPRRAKNLRASGRLRGA